MACRKGPLNQTGHHLAFKTIGKYVCQVATNTVEVKTLFALLFSEIALVESTQTLTV